jgi:trimeric autotransporter adhesin
MRAKAAVLIVAACGHGVCGAFGQGCEPRWSEEFGLAAPNMGVYMFSREVDRLYVGGEFTEIGGLPAARVAAYEGGVWSALGPGFTLGTGCHGSPPVVVRLRRVMLPSVDGLVAGGLIADAGGVSTEAVALWDSAGWRTMGEGLSLGGCVDCCAWVGDATVFDDGTGPALFATGGFNIPSFGIARWSGRSWEDVGGGLAVTFPSLQGGSSLLVHNDGTGAALYVGGSFHAAGGVPVQGIARWDGTAWSRVGEGPDYGVSAMIQLDAGAGPALLAARVPSAASGELWLWDGRVWERLVGAFNAPVRALAVFDDGAGPSLYAGGGFTAVDGRPAAGLARWDGAAWREVAGGVAWPGRTASVHVLEPVPHRGAWALVIGGRFTEVGAGIASHNIARLIGCLPVCYADCDGDGALDFFDFLCFQNAFLAGEPYADCDGNGVLDFFDFLCFQNEFLAGCP